MRAAPRLGLAKLLLWWRSTFAVSSSLASMGRNCTAKQAMARNRRVRVERRADAVALWLMSHTASNGQE